MGISNLNRCTFSGGNSLIKIDFVFSGHDCFGGTKKELKYPKPN